MTKEEIVSSLKEQAQEKYDSASFMRMNEGDVLMEAAKMLRDQQASANLDRRRWEGCPQCTFTTTVRHFPRECRETRGPSFFDYYDGMYIELRAVNEAVLVWIVNDEENEFPIRYCPLCGRPLTEEAWAEMERRINDGTT